MANLSRLLRSSFDSVLNPTLKAADSRRKERARILRTHAKGVCQIETKIFTRLCTSPSFDRDHRCGIWMHCTKSLNCTGD